MATKLHPNLALNGKVDWRCIGKEQFLVEPWELPTEVKFKIHCLMRNLGLVFGSIDFIVTANNEYVFLEVNEQGQFLWIEELNPSIKMLDIFIKFLLSKTIDYTWWNPSNPSHEIIKYLDGVTTPSIYSH